MPNALALASKELEFEGVEVELTPKHNYMIELFRVFEPEAAAIYLLNRNLTPMVSRCSTESFPICPPRC